MSDELSKALADLEQLADEMGAAKYHIWALRLAAARARVEALCKPPEGWRLVPAEPTGEMVKAGIAANDGIVSDIYRAMLAAAPPPPGTAPKREALSEEQIVACLIEAGCLGTVKMSFESGPYWITRTSINAERFARAIERAHGIGCQP